MTLQILALDTRIRSETQSGHVALIPTRNEAGRISRYSPNLNQKSYSAGNKILVDQPISIQSSGRGTEVPSSPDYKQEVLARGQSLTSYCINFYCEVTISIINAILFHFIFSTSSLDITVKPKTTENFRTAANLLSNIYKTFTLKQLPCLSNACHCTSYQKPIESIAAA
jgi:hypothetical protein